MPTPYKLKLLNGVLKLKTFSDQVLSILGIKDLGTRTGNVTNGVVDWSIQHFTKTTAQWTADVTTILLDGQIGVEDTGTTTYKFKIGNGVDLWSALGYAGGSGGAWGTITGTLSNQTDLQTALNNKEPLKGADDNYVTDAQLVVISNTSGTNTGDNATNTTSNTYADGKVTQVITNGVTDKAPSEDAVFDALALKQNIVSGVDDTEIGYLNGVTSAIQTQLDAKVNKSRFAFNGKTSITGVATETNICSFKIDGGAYASTDGFKFDFTPFKGVTASTITYRAYVGTSSGARTNQIMASAITGANRSGDVTRRYYIDGGNLDTCVPFTSNAQSGLSGFSTINTPISVNMANDLWITISAQGMIVSETVGILGASITPLK